MRIKRYENDTLYFFIFLTKTTTTTMATLIAGLIGCATSAAGLLGSSAITIGTYLYQGIALAGSLFWSIGAWMCAGISFLFACCTGCGHKSFSEVLRPVEEWDESEAKRAGSAVCCLSCLLSCFLIVTIAAILMFLLTYFWYL